MNSSPNCHHVKGLANTSGFRVPRPFTSHPHTGKQHHRPAPVSCQASNTHVKDLSYEPVVKQQQGRTARKPEDLNDPAKIGAKGQATVQVPAYAGGVSLQSYMTLPVEQYFVLDPRQIRHLGGNRFLLLVPRINILNVWLEPEVEIVVATVRASDGSQKVVLQAENCRIKGSDLIENLRIDQRFCMRFTTELTWDAVGTQPQPVSASSNKGPFGGFNFNGLSLGSSGPSGGSWDDAQQAAGPTAAGTANGSISGDAVLEVWCEVIPPFNLMPREVLQNTCNVVMHGLVNTLLPLFLRNLGADWVKWSADPAYREERAKRSKPMA